MLNILACPRDAMTLEETLICPQGHQYHAVNGIPVLLCDDIPANHSGITRTLNGETEGHWTLDAPASTGIDPIVQRIIAATNGLMYRDLIGRLSCYPIPQLRLPLGQGKTLLDIGCNWGRWTIAAALKGYTAIGVDPDLEALLAAQRVAESMHVNVDFVCGDARMLPFQPRSIDRVFSYSVLQHFSREDVSRALGEIARVLTLDGESLIQMPNALGLRSAYNIARRRGKPRDFDVRYWTIGQLERAFRMIGETDVTVDGFFGLGIQASDAPLLSRKYRAVIAASETLRKFSAHLPLRYVADSLYVHSRRSGPGPSLVR